MARKEKKSERIGVLPRVFKEVIWGRIQLPSRIWFSAVFAGSQLGRTISREWIIHFRSDKKELYPIQWTSLFWNLKWSKIQLCKGPPYRDFKIQENPWRLFYAPHTHRVSYTDVHTTSYSSRYTLIYEVDVHTHSYTRGTKFPVPEWIRGMTFSSVRENKVWIFLSHLLNLTSRRLRNPSGTGRFWLSTLKFLLG